MKKLIARFVAKRLVAGRIKDMLDKLTGKLSGYRTYITAWGGLIIAVVASAMGGIDLPGAADIPAFDAKMLFEMFWAAIVVTFLRKGVESK